MPLFFQVGTKVLLHSLGILVTLKILLKMVCQSANTHITQALTNFNGHFIGPKVFSIVILHNASLTPIILIIQTNIWFLFSIRLPKSLQIHTVPIKKLIKITFQSLFNFFFFYQHYDISYLMHQTLFKSLVFVFHVLASF